MSGITCNGASLNEQALQGDIHNDAVECFPLPPGSRSTDRALLAINHEYTDDGMLHADGMKTWAAEKVRKSQGYRNADAALISRPRVAGRADELPGTACNLPPPFTADAVRLRVWDEHAKVTLSHPVTTEAAVMELARLMKAILERHR